MVVVVVAVADMPPPRDGAAELGGAFARGVVAQVDDSTLTPLPLALEPARQRALAYLRQRLAAGDVLQSQHLLR